MSFDPEIAGYRDAWAQSTTATGPVSQLASLVRSRRWAGDTGRIRRAYAAAGGGAAGKKAIELPKKRLPCVTLASAALVRSKRAAAAALTGLVGLDVDHLEDAATYEKARAALIAHPSLVILYRSPSGAGLKGAIRVPAFTSADPHAYEAAWLAVSRWMQSIGLENDSATRDCSRLAFVAHDPDCYFNPNAEPFPLADWARPDDAKPAMQHGGEGNNPDAPADVVERARRYLATVPASVEGQGGRRALYRAAVYLVHGFRLSTAQAVDVLSDDYNPRCDPPWGDDMDREFWQAVENAATQPHERPRGWLADKPRTKEVLAYGP